MICMGAEHLAAVACCSDRTSQNRREELAEPYDPTLSSCCRRDRLEQIRIDRAKAALLDVDRIDARLRAKSSVFALPSGQAESTSDLESIESEPEELALQRIKENRLSQLQAAQRKEQSPSAACGGLRQYTEARATELLKASRSCVVVHLTSEGDSVDQEIDEYLDGWSFREKGTQFWRVPLLRNSNFQKLGGPYCGPALMVFRSACLISQAPISNFEQDGCFMQEKVDNFLGDAKACEIESQDDSTDSEAQERDWRDPCNICGRRYYHQHFPHKSLYNNEEGEQSD